jgi:cation diffusion facilitator family transporter
MDRSSLTRYAWLSIFAGAFTLSLKGLSYLMTGSIAVLSDALESLVNIVAAIFALIMLIVAARPPDVTHPFGHSKAEYFASGLEGVLIVCAALGIWVSAGRRLMHPTPLEQTGAGLALTALATGVNLGVALTLLRVGRRHNSITLEADARHLLTDVWTSLAVIAGVAAVSFTGWLLLDPVLAIAVSVQICWTGWRLIQRSVMGLMDSSLPSEEVALVVEALERYRGQGVEYHALRTQRAGARRFVSVHVLVPDHWTVHAGHQMLEKIEADIRKRLANATVFTHLEPVADPVSWADQGLDRTN